MPQEILQFGKVTIDTTKWSRLVYDLGRLLPQDLGYTISSEVRRLLKQIIAITPPKNRAQGEKAVRKDLNKLFTGVTDELLNTVGSEHGVSNVVAWYTKKDGEKYKLEWDRIDPTGAGMDDFHHRNQNRRGHAFRVKKKGRDAWHAAYVVSFEDLANYRNREFSHVGREKAGWWPAYKSLGGRLPSYITRHESGARGEVSNHLLDKAPSITVVNRAIGIVNITRQVSDALRIRSEAIRKRIKLILSDYGRQAHAKKDLQPAFKGPASDIEVDTIRDPASDS